MGAWGVGVFENDDAADWLLELEDSQGVDLIDQALHGDTDAYLEAPDACVMLAAATVLLGLRNAPHAVLPDSITAWLLANRGVATDQLVPTALQCMDRVLAPNSELRELWEENGDEYSAWVETVNDLKRQLKA